MLSFLRQPDYYIIAFFACQQLFSSFLNFFFQTHLKRRRRDLNPRAATNDLLPFQGSPFNHLGTSAWLNHIPFGIRYSILYQEPILPSSVYTVNGESGIRTHAPFRTNGFQDRLVMTTSISLQAFSQTYFCILAHDSPFVKRFVLIFLSFFDFLENSICVCLPILVFPYRYKVFHAFSFIHNSATTTQKAENRGWDLMIFIIFSTLCP